MNSKKLPFEISPRHQAYLALLLWGVAVLLLLRHSVFGIDESAARSLLLSWSIADQVASSVTTLGMPDLRILLFLPAGYLWTGSVFAAKVLTGGLLAVTAWLLYAWKCRASGAEGALLATGLLLISPLALAQIDSVGAGVYLVGAFAIGGWLDAQYRANPRPFNGWYFAQLVICAFSVSVHPAGLAYPIALLWSWRTLPLSAKHQRNFLGGIVFSALFVLVLRMGWGDLTWFQNPLLSLGSALAPTGPDGEHGMAQWGSGIALLVAACAAVVLSRRELWTDLTGRTLLIGLLVGATVGDQAWALVALAAILYFGVPLLLRAGRSSPEAGFLKQRGWVLALLFICSTLFMGADKALYAAGQTGGLSAQDELIKALAVAAEDERKAAEADEGEKKRARFIVASEWPGRTMLACKCDTFPLPPVERDPETQLAKLHGVTHLLLDPKRTANIELARNLSLLGGVVETLALQPGGVMLHVKEATESKPQGKPL